MGMKYKILLVGACAFATSATFAQTAQPVTPTAVVTPVAPVAPATVILPAATAVTFSMDKALASDKRDRVKGDPKLPKGKERITNRGEIFYMTVTQDVKAGDRVVIPKGSRGVGEVTLVTGRGGFGKSGKLEVKMNYVEVGANKYLMEGSHLQKGKGRGGAAVAGTIIAGAIAGAFIHGDDADLPLAMELTFHTKEAIKL